jgi:O-antigen ligase
LAGTFDSKLFRLKAWYYFAFTTMLLAVVLTQSRGGLVGVVVILLFLFRTHRRAHFRTLIVFGTLGLVTWHFLPALLPRFTGPVLWSGSGRLEIWQVGIEAFKTYWITGSGLGTFPFAYREVLSQKGGGLRGVRLDPDAHNLFLQLGVELGVMGVLIFLAALGTLFWRLGRGDRSVENPLPPLSLQAALIGFLVSAFFSGVIRVKLFWLTVGLSMLVVVWSRSHSLVERRAMRRREEVTQARSPHGHEG